MAKHTDIKTCGVRLYFLEVQTRLPLKFGPETLTEVTCARVCLRVTDARGRTAEGWGETPLSVQWAWPAAMLYTERHAAMRTFCLELARAWVEFPGAGHALEVGYDFQTQVLPGRLREFNDRRDERPPMPWLAALVCCAAFDLALHDAYGQLLERPVYETYNGLFLHRDLADLLPLTDGEPTRFINRFPQDFFEHPHPLQLPAWHLVGGLDALEESELKGDEPKDGYPVTLRDWIKRDGLYCLKVKLRGNDAEWDYARLARVGRLALTQEVQWLSADFNCTVRDPEYVNEILDRLMRNEPRIHGMLLYVEQPFPYELEEHRIDVRSVAARKPLFLDESAHDWRMIRLGRSLGWTGVALKTCKTQTSALLSLCWAKSHGMTLMVQDLTNPMLAQIPHVLLAAHAGTIMGVETNAMQFYPDASIPEALVHPGLFVRVNGKVNLTSVSGPGFGMRLERIQRELPPPAIEL